MSQAAITKGVPGKLGLERLIAPAKNCRRIGKKDMRLNDATPKIEVDPETYEVRVDGAAITCEPAKILPLAQRYFLF
jgi:urease subunit alpha